MSGKTVMFLRDFINILVLV